MLGCRRGYATLASLAMYMVDISAALMGTCSRKACVFIPISDPSSAV